MSWKYKTYFKLSIKDNKRISKRIEYEDLELFFYKCSRNMLAKCLYFIEHFLRI